MFSIGSAVEVLSNEEEQLAGEGEQRGNGVFLSSIGLYADISVEQMYQLTVVLPPGHTPRTIKTIVPAQPKFTTRHSLLTRFV